VLYNRSQKTVESDSADESRSDYILPSDGNKEGFLLALVNLKNNTEDS